MFFHLSIIKLITTIPVVGKLYKLTSNSFVNESGGATYNTAADGYWDFVKFECK